MVSEQYNKSTQQLLYFCGLLIAISFYSFGNFGFLNIFDARREIQIAILLMTMPVLILVAAKKTGRFLKEPLWLLVLCFLIAEIMIRQQPIYMLNYLVALITIGALLTIERKYVTFISKCIIVLCALFSVMGILEYIILWFKPTLADTILSNYSSTTSADPISNISVIEYLGFFFPSGTTILGHQVCRMESFASEPSVLVYSFFCPGILSLTYRGWVKILSIPILLFATVMISSGTIWLCILFGLSFPCFAYFFKKHANLGSVVILLSIVVMMLLLCKIDISLFMRNVTDLFLPFFSVYSLPVEKYTSGVVRLTTLRYAFENVWSHPFGAASTTGGGLIVRSGLICGYLGLLLSGIVFYRLFKYSVYVWQAYGKKEKMFSALLCGTLVVVSSFSSYGWPTYPGLIMFTLLYLRIKDFSGGLADLNSMNPYSGTAVRI